MLPGWCNAQSAFLWQEFSSPYLVSTSPGGEAWPQEVSYFRLFLIDHLSATMAALCISLKRSSIVGVRSVRIGIPVKTELFSPIDLALIL